MVTEGVEGESAELQQLSDDELVTRFVRGDSAACYLLFARLRNRTWAIVRAGHQDDQWVEDTARTVFLVALENCRNFRGESSFGTWYRRLAQNVVVNELKKLRRRQAGQEIVEDSKIDDEDIADIVAQRDLQAKVLEQLSRLSPRLRDILVRRFFGGYSYREISEKTNVKVGTVKWRVHYGLRQIRERLIEQDGELSG